MKFKTQSLIFYSKSEWLRTSFEKYIENSNIRSNKYYRFIYDSATSKKLSVTKNFSEVFDIFECLDLEVLVTSIFIVDPYCLTENKTGSTENEYELLLRFILLYPEIKVIFLTSENNLDFLDSFIEEKDFSAALHYNHIFSFDDLRASFELGVAGQSNMFDFSGLRTIVKENIILDEIKAQKDNFDCLHKSRKELLAFTVDEENRQAYFNAYTLYRYGFRVMPIISFRQLENIKKFVSENSRTNFDQKLLIIRDWDLQFEDYDSMGDKNILAQLRELNYDVEAKKWIRNNSFWKDFTGCCFYFVTRYSKNPDKDQPKPNCKLLKLDTAHYFFENNDKECTLIGLPKPIGGMTQILDILELFYNFLSKRKNDGSSKKGQKITHNLYNDFWNNFFLNEEHMNVRRQDHGHAISPKILHLAESMINRAQKYYDQKMFMTAALLSQEAMEILNGFHFLEMLKALYLRTVAETQLEAELIGISDNPDNVHIKFREVKSLAKRICWNNDEAYRNLLNQLAIDLRHIYMDKELLESADACLREYVQNAAGMNILSPFKKSLF
ncbi:MAG TPA: hypothetical protein VFF33_13545 [Ignavibacteriaceae bacterium]|nr:hypothetical protein [Ignavibacteriaceae bacterium]